MAKIIINQILNIFKNYDRETKGTLTLDFKQEVLKNKNYTEVEFIKVLINDWIPIWLEEREEDKEAIKQLVSDLNKLV